MKITSDEKRLLVEAAQTHCDWLKSKVVDYEKENDYSMVRASRERFIPESKALIEEVKSAGDDLILTIDKWNDLRSGLNLCSDLKGWSKRNALGKRILSQEV